VVCASTPRATQGESEAHCAALTTTAICPSRSALNPSSAKLDARQLSLSLFFDEPATAPAPPAASPQRTDPIAGERHRQVLLGGEPTAYRLKRGKRRTIGFQIDDNGLTVSAPRWISLREIEAAIGEKERWIRTKLTEWRDYKARRKLPDVRWHCGGTLPYLGTLVTLRLRAEVESTQLLRDAAGAAELHLALPADALEGQIKDTVQAWLQTEARRVLGERLALLGERLNAANSVVTVVGALAVGLVHARPAHPPELAADPLRPAGDRLRGGARTGAPEGNEPQPALLARRGAAAARIRGGA
jgi:predicted metal-dependent hydrolase